MNVGDVRLSRPLMGEMRIVKTIVGKPMLAVEGRTKGLFNSVGIANTHVSISHDAGTTVAWALLEVESPASYPVKSFPASPNRIYGIGVDLVEIERIAKVLAGLSDRL